MNLPTRLALAVTAAGLALSACGAPATPRSTPAPTPAPPTATSAAATPEPRTSSPAAATAPFGYQPLFPFASLTEAQEWQASYESGGHQPWHLSADRTALAFTQGYLGFHQIDMVARRVVGHQEAHVTVGLTLPNGAVSHAAIIHLVKFGSGPHSPWEVVGTDDTTLTLDTPTYGATVTSPVTVGGTISGVDENLAVEVHRLGAPDPVGSYCCRPAGGESSPWSARVFAHAGPGQVLTIVVHTGGHIARVERFAITGVRTR